VSLLVQKYGGTSVASIDRIKQVAAKVLAARRAGHDLVVVVSAMAGETNRLIALAQQISDLPDEREKDVLLASGEQVSVALLTLALKEAGQPARSFLGHQVRIATDKAYGKARILSIDSTKILQSLKAGEVVVIAGFQGVDEDDNITTLGRGGSDTSAVALAAFLSAQACEIYTDVEGVYTTDPGICPHARKLARISYDEMIELASTGAKVLEIRSVEFAKNFSVPVHVRSTFTDVEGTWLINEEEGMSDVLVSGVACDRNEAKITLLGVPDRPGIAYQILGPIGDANIDVDMIVQNVSHDGLTDFSFTVHRNDFAKAMEILKMVDAHIKSRGVVGDDKIAKVSVVGVGMRSHAGIASTAFRTLAEEGINIQMISTSEIKISIVIDEKYLELAVRVLHKAFELEHAA